VIAGSWRKLHNEELCNFHCSPSVIKVIISVRIRLAGYVAHLGKMRNAYNILVREPESKRPFSGSRHSGVDGI
jgi:hypothetical protein